MRVGAMVRLVLAATLVLAGCTDDPGHDGNNSHPADRVSATGGALAAPAVRDFRPDQQKRLQQVLDDIVSLRAASDAAGARGLTAAVVSDRGVWTGAAGTDGIGATLDPRAMMPIDSITKTFTAAEVLRLVSEGRVDLDAPLSRYVTSPWVANGATVRQVLSMRSGVTDPPQRTFGALARAHAASRATWTIERTLAFLKPNVSSPTAAPVYANANYLLLGLLIQNIRGRSMARVLRAELFDPAHLSRIAAQDEERPTPPVGAPPTSLVPHPDGYLPGRAWATLGHDCYAGIAADAQTVATWGYDLYGGRVLPSASVRQMTTPPSVQTAFPGIGYGLGTMVYEGLATDATYGHSGASQASSSILAVLPARHLAVAVLSPEGDRPVEQAARDLIRAVQ